MHAIPAKPGKTVVRQADGTYVTVVLHGDEHSHFTTTVDGYTLVLDNGSWQYALKQNGDLVSSGMTAHDAPARTDAEKTFLAGHEKMLRAEPTAVQQEAVKRSRSL